MVDFAVSWEGGDNVAKFKPNAVQVGGFQRRQGLKCERVGNTRPESARPCSAPLPTLGVAITALLLRRQIELEAVRILHIFCFFNIAAPASEF